MKRAYSVPRRLSGFLMMMMVMMMMIMTMLMMMMSTFIAHDSINLNAQFAEGGGRGGSGGEGGESHNN